MDQPWFISTIRGGAISSPAHVEARAVRHSQFTYEAIGDSSGHCPALMTRNLIVAMMVARWVEGALALEKANIDRVFPQDPIHLIHREDQCRRLVSEPVNQRRGPGPLEDDKIISEVRWKKLIGFACRLLAQAERIIGLAATESHILFQRLSDPGIERIVFAGQGE